MSKSKSSAASKLRKKFSSTKTLLRRVAKIRKHGETTIAQNITARTMTAEKAQGLLPPPRPKKYQAIYDALRALKPNEAAVFDMPTGSHAAKIVSRLSVLLNIEGIKAPEGFSFYKKATEGNKVVVRVMPKRGYKAKK